MMGKVAAWASAGICGGLALVSVVADGRQLTPPAVYSGSGQPPARAAVPKDSALNIVQIPEASLQKLFRIDPAYHRAAAARINVVGAFAVAAPADTHLATAWSMGFLPIILQFSDGRCFKLDADYIGNSLSSGRVTTTSCAGPRGGDKSLAPPPSSRPLRLIGSSWGFDAWTGDHGRTAIVTAPQLKTSEPLFTAQMTVTAMMAMTSIDSPSGNVTLVGNVAGKLTVVTLDVGW